MPALETDARDTRVELPVPAGEQDMRRRQRSAMYRTRRVRRHAGRHAFIDTPLPLGGSKITEYRRGLVVSVDINPGDL